MTRLSRRTVLATLGACSVGLAGCQDTVAIGRDDGDTKNGTESGPSTSARPQAAQQVPPDVQVVADLATAFYRRLQQFYPDSRVFVQTPQQMAPEIVAQFTPDETKPAAIETAYSNVAVEYARIAMDQDYTDATTLTMVVGTATVVVPGSSFKAHVAGEINQEAYLETVAVTGTVDTGDGS